MAAERFASGKRPVGSGQWGGTWTPDQNGTLPARSINSFLRSGGALLFLNKPVIVQYKRLWKSENLPKPFHFGMFFLTLDTMDKSHFICHSRSPNPGRLTATYPLHLRCAS